MDSQSVSQSNKSPPRGLRIEVAPPCSKSRVEPGGLLPVGPEDLGQTRSGRDFLRVLALVRARERDQGTNPRVSSNLRHVRSRGCQQTGR